MGYVASGLTANERIVYQASLHWAIFLKGTSLVFSGVVAAIALKLSGFTIAAPAASGDLQTMFGLFVLISVFVAIGLGLWFLAKALLDYISTELAITTKRVIAKRGILSRSTVELLLQKVETVGIHQSVFGRLLNYGTVTVVGTGGTHDPFPFIHDPLVFRHQLQNQLAPG